VSQASPFAVRVVDSAAGKTYDATIVDSPEGVLLDRQWHLDVEPDVYLSPAGSTSTRMCTTV